MTKYSKYLNEAAEARSNVLADILSLPCLQDEGLVMAKDMAEHWGLTETGVDRILNNGKILGKNELRTELRQALTAYFMGTVGGGNMGSSQDNTTPTAQGPEAGNLSAGGTK